MRISLHWLGEWVDTGTDAGALAHQLTMAGLEIEAIERLASEVSGVVVGEVLSVEKHPDAEKLSVCKVNAGSETLQIVCGAANVRAGLMAPLATIGAKLPGGMQIKRAKLRGVESFGMLCSAKELGLEDEQAGLLELPSDSVPGTLIQRALDLDDVIFEVNLTPNRGDCMSVLGLAREVAAIRKVPLHEPQMPAVQPSIQDKFPVHIDAPAACRKFVGRVIRCVQANARAPLWMRERLRRAGLRSVSAVVDVTNYVMIELGQPMHAYDLSQLDGEIRVRQALEGELLELLDGRTVTLTPDVLVIADKSRALGMAGVMGGAASGISDSTRDVFLEVAYFEPHAIAGRGRRYGLVTDASQRFERGVDPHLQERAIERATQLLLECAGGQAGPVTVTSFESPVAKAPIVLRQQRIGRLLGIELSHSEVGSILNRLGMHTVVHSEGWTVRPPSWRFDITIEEDLIEEVARLHGFDKIPPANLPGPVPTRMPSEAQLSIERLSDLLVDRGYQEAITYSFVDPKLQGLLWSNTRAVTLANPLSAELAEMRVSLWPGLIHALRENQRRQQPRARLFEVGRAFLESDEVEVIAGVAGGSRWPTQWDAPDAAVDFFDVKGDVEALIALNGLTDEFTFERAEHPALHPGQSARICRGGRPIGWIGTLHPSIVKQLDLTYTAVLFELETAALTASRVPRFAEISRFPSIRRDLAVIVPEAVTAAALGAVVRGSAGELLREWKVLSVYRGEQIEKGKKSIALALILQDTSRTLTDADADALVAQVTGALRAQLGAGIRDK
jgi:phenylalanyl-tRNA synthetase beta chain